MLPKWYQENHVSRTATGEQHVWMHDFNSLQKLIKFSSFEKVNNSLSLTIDSQTMELSKLGSYPSYDDI